MGRWSRGDGNSGDPRGRPAGGSSGAVGVCSGIGVSHGISVFNGISVSHGTGVFNGIIQPGPSD